MEKVKTMAVYAHPSPRSTRTDRRYNPDQRRSADFARAAVFTEFGYRHGRALDYGDFTDRLPNELPVLSPRARSK